MKKLYIIALLPDARTFGLSMFTILCFCSLASIAQTKIWDRRFGGTDFDEHATTLRAVDGGYLLGGPSSSNISGDKTQNSRGYTDYWVVKIDDNGIKLWDRRYGGSAEDYLSAMVRTKDGGYLLGGWSKSGKSGDKTSSALGWGDFWVVKINKRGRKLWDRRYGGDREDKLISIVGTEDGGFILAGNSYSDANGDVSEPTRGNDDFWIIKINEKGFKQWDKRYGGNDSDLLTEIVPAHGGGFILGGRSASDVGGEKSERSRGDADYWVLRIDDNGNQLWDKTFGGPNFEMVAKLQPTPDGGYLIGGATDSDGGSGDISESTRSPYYDDFWIVKIDNSGNKIWDRRYGGDHVDQCRDIEPTSDGGFLMGGTSYSHAGFEKSEEGYDWGDFWVLKVDSDGNKIWDKTFGGSYYDGCYDLITTNSGDVLLSGGSGSNISGDKTQNTWGNSNDLWTVKMHVKNNIPLFPAHLIVACNPFCGFADLHIRSKYFENVASFSFRITLPKGKARFRKSDHWSNPDLQSRVNFKWEHATSMMVTWKNKQQVSLKDEITLLSASIEILDSSASFETCVSDVRLFNEKGERIDASECCNAVDFEHATAARIAVGETYMKESEEKLTVYPNPGTGVFGVVIPEAGVYTLHVRDANGKVVSRKDFSSESDHHIEQLDLQELPKGVYLVVICNGKKRLAVKVVKA